jgi:hypothetical protein
MGDKETIRFLQNGLGSAAVSASNISIEPNKDFGVWNWINFIGTAQPRCIDTSILGTVRLHIVLAGSEVLVAHAATVAKSFTITNNYFTVDTLAINDGHYYSVINERLSNTENPIEIPFNTVNSFSPGTTSLNTTVQGVISSESLDYLLGTYQDSTYLDGTLNAVLNTSSFFKTGSSNVTGASFTINNTAFPNFELSPKDAFLSTVSAIGLAQDTVGQSHSTLSNMTNWQGNAYTAMVQLNHKVGADERLRSGLNLKGTNSQIGFTLKGTESSIQPILYAGHTAVLRVLPYKQIQVIQ